MNDIKTKLSLLLKVVVAIIFTSIATEVNATNYYIAPSGTGNDANNGTAAGTPKLTLQSVFNTYDLNSGDVINVAAGTYTEKSILVGTNDEGFTIQGAALSSGVPTSIFDSDQTARWLRMTSDNNDNISFVNLKIKDYLEPSRGGGGIDYTDGASSPTGYDITGIVITNCFFDNCDTGSGGWGGAILYYNTAGIAVTMNITGCSFYNSNGTLDGPTIYVYNNLAVTATVSKCKIYDNVSNPAYNGYGIFVDAGSASTLTLTNSLIHSNSSTGSGSGAIYIGSGFTLTAYNNTIYNNTCVGCTAAGIYNNGTTNIYNSILKSNSVKDFYDNGTGNAYNCFYDAFTGVGGTGNVTTAANVTNAATDDYTLLSSSACINAGQTSGAPTDDITGATRNGNPDIGCYEYSCPANYAGTYTVGTGGTWTTLSAALADLKLCMTGSVILELNETYRTTNEASETYPLDFSGLPTTSSITLTIRPKSDVTAVITIDAAHAAAKTKIIDFNGNEYVTIDGRINSSGSTSLISIENQYTSGGTCVSFTNDANNNSIRYCTLKSNYGSSTSGVIVFGDGVVSGIGNSTNTIEYCIIDGTGTNADPATADGVAENGIYSSSATSTNSSNTIQYNEFKNIFIAQSAHLSTRGIFLSTGNTGWTIKNNYFYDAVSRTPTAQTSTHASIEISSGDGYVIDDNQIGGNAKTITSNWTVTPSSSLGFNYNAMKLTLGTTNTSYIRRNTITKMSFTSYYSSANYWKGIEVLSGKVQIGTGTNNGNTIGSNSATSINLLGAGRTTTPVYTGIDVTSISTVDISNNTIGGIVTQNTSAYDVTLNAILTAGAAGNFTISSNSIGGSNSNNISSGGASVGSANCAFFGIKNSATGTISISSNTFNNITSYGTGAATFSAIYNTGGAANISSNTIANLTKGTTAATTASSNYMIYNSSLLNVTISSNTISSITIYVGDFFGIYDDSPITSASYSHIISSNVIGSSTSGNILLLQTSASAVTRQNIGIYVLIDNAATKLGSVGSPIYTVSNNMVRNFTQTNDVLYQSLFAGVYLKGTAYAHAFVVTSNVISNLKITSTANRKVDVYGIYFSAGGANTRFAGCQIEKNKIYGCEIASTHPSNGGTYASFNGIYSATLRSGGTAYVSNNLIYFNNGSYTNGLHIIGIELNQSSATAYVIFNTVYIENPTGSSGDTGPTCSGGNAAYQAAYSQQGDNYVYNNIFYNYRTSTFTNSKYALLKGAATGITNWSNNYGWSVNTASYVFVPSSSDITATAWIASCSNDKNNNNGSRITTVSTDGTLTSTNLGYVVGTFNASAITGGTYDINGTAGNRNTSPYTNAYRGCFESPSSYYWVSGTGNWSDATSHWSNTSGGMANMSVPPTTTNDVYFDANSGGGTCTIDAAAYSNNLNTTNYTGTLAGTSSLDIYGSLTVGSGTTWSHTGNTSFKATSTGKTIASNAVVLATPISFNGSGGGWTLSDNLTLSTSSEFIMTTGTLNLGANTLSIAGDFAKASGFTFNANTGTVKFTGNSSVISGTTTTPSFYNIIVNKTTGQSLSLGGSATSLTCTNNLTLTSGKLNMQGSTLTVGTSSVDGSITGGSSTSYIVAYDSGSGIPGKVAHYINANAVLHNYPIGDLTYYTPLTFTLTGNAGLSSATFTVFTKPAQIPNMSTAVSNYLTRYWDGTASGMTTPTYSISYIYNDADIHGVETNFTPVKKSGTTWYSPTGSLFTNGTKQGTSVVDLANNTLTWNSLTTFSLYSAAADAATALPITLCLFDAKPYNKDVMVRWKTASESNNDYFTVERSEDGVNFRNIGEVKGAGNSSHLISYYLLDSDYLKGINYYRLKQTDFNGKYSYSSIVSVDMSIHTGVVVRTVNTLGQEVQEGYTGVVFDIYLDGTSVKRLR